jgi:hypothetical protein
MGSGLIIGCSKCITDEDLDKFDNEDNNVKGTIFNISIGGGMLCFCKEQLEKIYGVNKKYDRQYRLLAAGDPPDELYKTIGSMTDDEKIDNIIYENIKNGYEFTENLGHLPYYCDTCKKLFCHFYFEMVKEGTLYTPNYVCKKCNNSLEPVCPSWQKRDDMGWAKTLGSIKFNIDMYITRDEKLNVILKSNGTVKKLICDNCGNEEFKMFTSYLFD